MTNSTALPISLRLQPMLTPMLLRLFRIARLLRLLKVHKVRAFFIHLETNFNVHQGVSRLVSIVALVMIVAHCVGCAWFAIGNAASLKNADDECLTDDASAMCSWAR